MSDEEIAVKLTEMINDNRNKYDEKYLTEDGIINTYKRVLKKIKKE